jgi:enoyl-CoA hydratase/carnithine racemase
MAFEQILVDARDGILTVTLNRPEKLNAFTPRMRDELIAAFDRADADDEVRAVVVTGAGRAFCAGADLSLGADTFDYPRREGLSDPGRHRDGGGRLALRIYESRKPVIAAVNGPAVGIGATMTLPMDLRLAAIHAGFGFVFTRRGIVPEACSSWFLPRLVGVGTALEWVLSGRTVWAEEALRRGLVRSLHAPADLLPEALALAREIAENAAPVSVTLARHLLWRMLGADHPMAAHRIESRAMFTLGQGPDAKEGVRAFLEKRPPRFAGRPSRDMPDFFPWWPERTFEETR